VPLAAICWCTANAARGAHHDDASHPCGLPQCFAPMVRSCSVRSAVHTIFVFRVCCMRAFVLSGELL
ncbi:unnamed protein product, partial [Ectocarpus sp. 8 AP-2014]